MGHAIRQRLFLSVLGASLLGGCGTYVPDIQEFWGTPADASIKVNNIASQVQCELRQAVGALLEADELQARKTRRPRQLTWLTGWGATASLTFVIDERSSLNPGLSITKPLANSITVFPNGNVTNPQNFVLGLGGVFSTAATRTSKVSMFFQFAQLPKRDPALTCIPDKANADLFVQSDLKLRDWLFATVAPHFTDIARFPPAPKDVITHEVKFQIITSGNVTPTWRLIPVTQTTSASNLPFLDAKRDRIQTLVITMGKLETVPGPPGGPPVLLLGTAARNSHLASEIGVSVATSIRGLQP